MGLFLKPKQSKLKRGVSTFACSTGTDGFVTDQRPQPEKAMAPHSSTLAWKTHGRRSPVGCSTWGREESDTTERLHFHFSFSCFGEGNGNPLQCSCLENPRDGGAWWAAVYGVARSGTRLKRLSSSSRAAAEAPAGLGNPMCGRWRAAMDSPVYPRR